MAAKSGEEYFFFTPAAAVRPNEGFQKEQEQDQQSLQKFESL